MVVALWSLIMIKIKHREKQSITERIYLSPFLPATKGPMIFNTNDVLRGRQFYLPLWHCSRFVIWPQLTPLTREHHGLAEGLFTNSSNLRRNNFERFLYSQVPIFMNSFQNLYGGLGGREDRLFFPQKMHNVQRHPAQGIDMTLIFTWLV